MLNINFHPKLKWFKKYRKIVAAIFFSIASFSFLYFIFLLSSDVQSKGSSDLTREIIAFATAIISLAGAILSLISARKKL